MMKVEASGNDSSFGAELLQPSEKCLFLLTRGVRNRSGHQLGLLVVWVLISLVLGEVDVNDPSWLVLEQKRLSLSYMYHMLLNMYLACEDLIPSTQTGCSNCVPIPNSTLHLKQDSC